MLIPTPTETYLNDPVVVYDTMCEAANRLVGAYVARRRAGTDPDAASAAIRAVRAEIRSVGIHDTVAQRAKTREFQERFEAERA